MAHLKLLIMLVMIWCVSFKSEAMAESISNETVRNGTEVKSLFHWQDYSVLTAMLVTSCMIGIYYGRFSEKLVTGDDFLLGGSNLATIPMAVSLTASFITAIELLGNPAEMYLAGAQFWMICSAFLLVVPIASQLYLPVFMKLRLTSCYEYLEMRFCKSVRFYASTLYFLQIIMYTAVCVYAPALALSDVTGLNVYLAVSLVYVVCILYGSLGGMKAVVMTDLFQSIVLMGSLITILAMSASKVGGIGAVFDYAWKTDRMRLFDMNPDPTVRHSFWSVVIGGTTYWVSMFCANQGSVQKYMSVQKIEQVRVALWISCFGLILIFTINFLTGAVLALHYADCDPIQAGIINASDRLLPLYVATELSSTHGIAGFFVTGIFAASLGTVATELNSLAAICCQDLVTGCFGKKIPDHKEAMIARWVSIVCGLLSFSLIFIVEKLGPVLQLALSFNGMAGGIALGLFTLGMFFPWSNAKGAVTGGIVGLLVVLIAGIGAQSHQMPINRLPASTNGCVVPYNMTLNAVVHPEDYQDEAVCWLFRVSYLWYTGLGCVSTIATGIIVSVITGSRDPATVPEDLLSPPIAKLIHHFPKKYRSRRSEYVRLD